MIGKKVIVRGTNSGVYYGTLASLEGQVAKMTNVRNLWYWEGAASIMQIAKEGVKLPRECKFTVSVANIVLTDVIEVIECTSDAIANIEGISPWKMQ